MQRRLGAPKTRNIETSCPEEPHAHQAKQARCRDLDGSETKKGMRCEALEKAPVQVSQGRLFVENHQVKSRRKGGPIALTKDTRCAPWPS